jgi:uncharacterized protein YPO0396
LTAKPRFITLEFQTTTCARIFRNRAAHLPDGALGGRGKTANIPKPSFCKSVNIIEIACAAAKDKPSKTEAGLPVTDVRRARFAASECWREDKREHTLLDSGRQVRRAKEKLATPSWCQPGSTPIWLGLAKRAPKSFRFVVIDEAFGRGSYFESAHTVCNCSRKQLTRNCSSSPVAKNPHHRILCVQRGFWCTNAEGRDSRLRNPEY